MLIDLSKEEGEDAQPPPKKKPPPATDAADEGDAAACIICLEPLTSEGEHRVVALKCGHLFGKSCIEVWVRQKKLCPQCKARAKLHDITPLYGGLPKVAAGRAAEELERELEAARHQQQQQEQENKRLKDMLEQLQQAAAQAAKPPQPPQYPGAGSHPAGYTPASFQVVGAAGFMPQHFQAPPQRHMSGCQPPPAHRQKHGPWDDEEQQPPAPQQQPQPPQPTHHDHYTRSGHGSHGPQTGRRHGAPAAAAAGHGGGRRGGHPPAPHPHPPAVHPQQRGDSGGVSSHPQGAPHPGTAPPMPQPPAPLPPPPPPPPGQQQQQWQQPWQQQPWQQQPWLQKGPAQYAQYRPMDPRRWFQLAPNCWVADDSDDSSDESPEPPHGGARQAGADGEQEPRHRLKKQFVQELERQKRLQQEYDQQQRQQQGFTWGPPPPWPLLPSQQQQQQQQLEEAIRARFAAGTRSSVGIAGVGGGSAAVAGRQGQLMDQHPLQGQHYLGAVAAAPAGPGANAASSSGRQCAAAAGTAPGAAAGPPSVGPAAGGAAGVGAGGSSSSQQQQHMGALPTPAAAAAAGGGGAAGQPTRHPVPAAATGGGGAAAAGAGGGVQVAPAAVGLLDHLGRRAQLAQQVIATIEAMAAGRPPPLQQPTAAAAGGGDEGMADAVGVAACSRKRPREGMGAADAADASHCDQAAGTATPAAGAAATACAGDATHPAHTSSQPCSQGASAAGSWPVAAGGRLRLVFRTTPPARRYPGATRAATGCPVDPYAVTEAGWGAGLQLQQQFGAVGSRACCLDVQQKVLLVADAPVDMGARIRRVSLLAPQYPQLLQLPGAGLVRALAPCPVAGGGGQLAVGSAQRGLLIASPDTGGIVASVPTPGPIWDVAWSPTAPCQLLLGLDRGRLGVADLRQPRGLLQLVTPSGPPAPQPLHALRVVVGGGGRPCQVQAAEAYHVLAACSGGVYLWEPSIQHPQQQQQQQPQPGPGPTDPFQLVLPSSLHGGTCESIALDTQERLLAVSFRSRPGGVRSGSGSGGGGGGSQPWVGSQAAHPPPAPAAAAGQGMTGAGAGMASHWVLKWGWEAAEGVEAGHTSQQAEAAGTQACMVPTLTAGDGLHSAWGAATAEGTHVGCRDSAGRHHSQLPLMRDVDGLPLHLRPSMPPDTLQLCGHTSSDTLTSGCFFHLPCCEGPLFASGDELSRSALIWDCSIGVGSRGAVLQRLAGLPSPLVSIQGGWSEQLGVGLLAAHCQDGVQVWQWEHAT